MRRQGLEQLHLLEAAVACLCVEHVENLHFFQRDATLVRPPHGAVDRRKVAATNSFLDDVVGQRAVT